MKLLFILFIFATYTNAQTITLNIVSDDSLETKVIDSIGYNKHHRNAKLVEEELNHFSERLIDIGYIQNQITENINKQNDSVFTAKIVLGSRIKTIYIYTEKNTILHKIVFDKEEKDTLQLPYTDVENFLNNTLQKVEEKGYAMAKIKLKNINNKGNKLYASIDYDLGTPRVLNNIVINFNETNTDYFPKGQLANLKRKYVNRTFSKNVVQKIHDNIEQCSFIMQTKYPEILFTKDTTKVYVYLEKKKSNSCDGSVGFFKDGEQNIKLTGFIDAHLENILKKGELFSLLWKSDGNDQKTFNTSIEMPYIFKTPLVAKAQLNIFRQDSTFQTIKTNLGLGYLFSYNTKVFAGYQTGESTNIQKIQTENINNYKNYFATCNFEYTKRDNYLLYPTKSSIYITTGFGNRETQEVSATNIINSQTYINLNAANTFYINKNNHINVHIENYYLKSANYLSNELYRFGGITSVRGFAENTLQANLMISLLTEYRYYLSNILCVHTIFDYAIFNDPTANIKNQNIYGIGLGMRLLTKNGVFYLALANGSTKITEINTVNAIVHLSYKVKF